MVLMMPRIASSSAADWAVLTGGASKAQGAATDRETLCGPDPGPQSIGLLGGKGRGVKPQVVRRSQGARACHWDTASGRRSAINKGRRRRPGRYTSPTGDSRSRAAISPNPKFLSVASKVGVSNRPDVKIARGRTGSLGRA